MLEYSKTILTKVSFDQVLFEKELTKAKRTMLGEELTEFKSWCYAQFRDKHGKILHKHL